MSGATCYHGPDECPDRCMCPCDLCYLLRTEAYTGDAIDSRLDALREPAGKDGER